MEGQKFCVRLKGDTPPREIVADRFDISPEGQLALHRKVLTENGGTASERVFVASPGSWVSVERL